MNTAIHPGEERTQLAVVTGGTGIEGIGGIAVMALAILALVGVLPALLTTIGGIVFGAAMLAAGLSIAATWSQLGSQVSETRRERLELGGGAGAETLVGIAAIALGVLALVGVAQATLLPALIITGGTGLLLSAGSTQRLNDLRMEAQGNSQSARKIARQAAEGGVIAQTIGGIAAIVLGILALVATPAAAAAGFGTLAQVGILVLGVTTAIAGGALSGKMGNMMRSA